MARHWPIAAGVNDTQIRIAGSGGYVGAFSISLGPERRRVTANSGFWFEPTSLQSYAGVLKTSASDDPNIRAPDFGWRTARLSRTSSFDCGKTTSRLISTFMDRSLSHRQRQKRGEGVSR